MSDTIVTEAMVEAAWEAFPDATGDPMRAALEAALTVAPQPAVATADEHRQVGSELRVWRMEHECSLRDVADDCGTRPSVVSSYEIGYWDAIDPTALLALGLYVANQEAQVPS